MTITLTIETYDSVVEDILPLLEDHYTEVEWGQDVIPLNPNLSKYEDMIMGGDCALYGMRKDGDLIGYASFFIYRHPHHKATSFASNDMLYIVPEHRSLNNAVSLLDFCETNLKTEGVDVMTYNFKSMHDHPELMAFLDFAKTEVVYSKYIG